jgi:hypothetical protein
MSRLSVPCENAILEKKNSREDHTASKGFVVLAVVVIISRQEVPSSFQGTHPPPIPLTLLSPAFSTYKINKDDVEKPASAGPHMV